MSHKSFTTSVLHLPLVIPDPPPPLPLNVKLSIVQSQNFPLFIMPLPSLPTCCNDYITYVGLTCKIYRFYQLKYNIHKMVLNFLTF